MNLIVVQLYHQSYTKLIEWMYQLLKTSVTKTKNPNPVDLGCSVFPNPSNTGFFQITLPDQQTISKLCFFDCTGKSIPFIQQKNNISAPNLANGIYWLEITWEAGSEIHRVVKME